jgi:hypothetical protein
VLTPLIAFVSDMPLKRKRRLHVRVPILGQPRHMRKLGQPHRKRWLGQQRRRLQLGLLRRMRKLGQLRRKL